MICRCINCCNVSAKNTIEVDPTTGIAEKKEKLQEHGIALPQSFVRLDAEVEALLMCLSKEAIA